jgi:hypothetical protein
MRGLPLNLALLWNFFLIEQSGLELLDDRYGPGYQLFRLRWGLIFPNRVQRIQSGSCMKVCTNNNAFAMEMILLLHSVKF